MKRDERLAASKEDPEVLFAAVRETGKR